MICTKFAALSAIEKITFIGQLVHAVQSDDFSFDMAEDLIQVADISGVFNGVVINPEVDENIKEGDKVFLPDGSIDTVLMIDFKLDTQIAHFDTRPCEFLSNCKKAL